MVGDGAGIYNVSMATKERSEISSLSCEKCALGLNGYLQKQNPS